jgi:hypothetical protein
MALENINPFRSRGSISDLQRRASLEVERVKLLSVRKLSECEAFGLDKDISFEAIRQSCWPISPALRKPADGASGGAPALPPRNATEELRTLRAMCATEKASRADLDINFQRLDQIDRHYHAVTLGNARLTDVKFSTTTMRSFVTWLESLTVLDKGQYGHCGECARKLLKLPVLTEPGSRFTLSELGTTSNLALPSDESQTATHFLIEILPLLRGFHDAVEKRGAGSAALEARIDYLRTPAPSLMKHDIDALGASTGGARQAANRRQLSLSLGDLLKISRVHQPLRDRPAVSSTLFPWETGFDS